MSVRQQGIDWVDLAACKGPHQTTFYGPMAFERKAERRRREARAKAICATCPVEERCREEALGRGEIHGIWGGLTEKERRAVNNLTC